MKKLSKLVNVIPILLKKNGHNFNFESMKLKMRKAFFSKKIDWFDLSEDDLNFKKLRRGLLG